MKPLDEAQRLRTEYERRHSDSYYQWLYSPFNPGQLFIQQSRERELLRLLRLEGYHQLAEKKILDVGCGGGSELRRYMGYGARPENLHGVDLMPDRIELARQVSLPQMHFEVCNAESLPYHDESFDLVLMNMVLSSVLDSEMRNRIAREGLRVLRLGGAVVWYDFWTNPGNPNTRGLRPKEVESLFPGCHYRWRRVTLAPPLARRIAPSSWLTCCLLEKIPWLCTHYLGLIKKG